MASIRQLGTVGRISLKRFAAFLQRESWKIEKSLARARFLSSAVGNGVTSSPLPEFEGVPGINNHQDLYRFSLENSDEFWSKLARSRLEWFKDFDQVSRCDMTTGSFEWFLNGKMNVTVNCVDRHYLKDPNKIALIWEKDEPGTHEFISYKQLYEMMNQMANMLKAHSVGKGDRVAIYMPACPLQVAAMLACARIGAVHSIVFAGFSADALAQRIEDASHEVDHVPNYSPVQHHPVPASATTVITTDQGLRGGKVIPLKQTVDEAVLKCPGVKRVFVSSRTGADIPMGKMDLNLEQEMSKYSSECPPEIMDSEDYLFLLYTSGSTGKPKGVAHSIAGYLLYANLTHKLVFDYNEGDIFGCVADIGWITGHTYVVYGPLSNGATSVLFESIPVYPDPGRYWEMVERLQINQLYTAPTAIRLLLKYEDEWVTKYDRSSLKTLGCVGEPLNNEAWEWYNNVVGEGRCPLVDTWWQTETGGIAIAPRPSAPGAEIIPGMPMRPFFGIDPVLLDPEKGHELTEEEAKGALCIRRPWPGMARTIYGHHDRFMENYFNPYPGYYFCGDGAHRHKGGYYQITGRMDDVINVSGHRLGTAEIEDAMDEHPDVAETAVVGFPHDIKGESIYAYIVLKEHIHEPTDEIIADLKSLVSKQIAKYAVPEIIQITTGLPKTRSGKIMRRILRKVAADKHHELGDISTLADPSVVELIVNNHIEIKKNMAANSGK